MKIGIIVDGEAEFRSLPKLCSRLSNTHQILSPLRADIQPLAPIPIIINAVKPRLLMFHQSGADLVIVLIDREDRDVCPGQWAIQLTRALNTAYAATVSCRLAVVIKNSCYENWLISDPEIFTKMPKRFKLSVGATNRIAPNKADHVDAQNILEAAVQVGAYSKVSDATKIMTHADPLIMAANSRSFRKFLREIEHPAYRQQSRNPVPLP